MSVCPGNIRRVSLVGVKNVCIDKGRTVYTSELMKVINNGSANVNRSGCFISVIGDSPVACRDQDHTFV